MSKPKTIKKVNETAEVEVGPKTETFIYQRHPCALKEPAPNELNIEFNGKLFSFHFYINNHGRYVALCNIQDCENVHGEGANWWSAAANCMSKILENMNYKIVKID